jgi:UDPglucose 6-dehydrogenase
MCEALRLDERLGTTHWMVPGPDGKFGFGGTCFPKDINALMTFSATLEQPTPLLNAVWQKNLEMRPERDWENDKGRAVI